MSSSKPVWSPFAPVTPEERKKINDHWDAVFAELRPNIKPWRDLPKKP